MKNHLLNFLLTPLFLLCTISAARSATNYVNINNTTPTAPYTSWATAATNIQHAIDASAAGDLILVSNGVYQVGARVILGLPNRVAVTKPLTLLSVNGPDVTTIIGYRVPGTINSANAIRCVYLTNGAVLSGFTLTNGSTLDAGDTFRVRSGGGVWSDTNSAVVTNCTLAGNSAFYGGGAAGCKLTNCTLVGNSAYAGGGAFVGNLNNCTLIGNSASDFGGGAYLGTLNNCTLSGNSAKNYGGGAYSGTLSNCTLSGNSATNGGGAYSGTLNNCTLSGNSAAYGGGAHFSTLNNCTLSSNFANKAGGAGSSTLNNCILSGNSASTSGGGTSSCTLNNCTLTGNSSASGGGSSAGWLYNCIVYDNMAPTNPNVESSGALNYCCTTPLPTGGLGNFTNSPLFVNQIAGDFRLQASSPCINAGANGTVTNSVDLDGSPRIVGDVVDVGAYEFQTSVRFVDLSSANPTAPYTTRSTAATNIQDAIDAALNGDLVLVTNGVYQYGGRLIFRLTNRVAVTKPITLLSVNGPAVTSIVGNQAPLTTNGSSAIRCVLLTNGAVLSGFTLTNGATISSNLVSIERSGGGVWCSSQSAVVSNCVITGNSAFFTGGGSYSGTLTNCTLTGNWAPFGGGAADAILNGCMLTGNTGTNSGGGAGGGKLNHCVLAGNTSRFGGGANISFLDNCIITNNTAAAGGGTYEGKLENCILTGNSAMTGGGASGGTLYNCTITGNFATNSSGGSSQGRLYNSIIYYNSAPTNENIGSPFKLIYSCTTPLDLGVGNFTNAPLFVNLAAGDLHLQAGSPCINSGTSGFNTNIFDLDANPRIVANTIDIGAYEYQSPGSLISHVWLDQYGLPTDGTGDFTDSDGDGSNNWQEWIAGTIPNDSASLFQLLKPDLTSSNVKLTWTSVTNRIYFVERIDAFGSATNFLLIRTNIAGLPGTTSYTNTSSTISGQAFYRVGVTP